jgi:hypothetical protein
VAEHLPSECCKVSSNPSATKQQQKRGKNSLGRTKTHPQISEEASDPGWVLLTERAAVGPGTHVFVAVPCS